METNLKRVSGCVKNEVLYEAEKKKDSFLSDEVRIDFIRASDGD